MIVGDMERKHNINLFLLSVLLLMTVSCSTTRNLPEDETLYVGVKNMEILFQPSIFEVRLLLMVVLL